MDVGGQGGIAVSNGVALRIDLPGQVK